MGRRSVLSVNGGVGAKKKKVLQDRYSITICGTRAKSRVPVTVARPRGWGAGIRLTDTYYGHAMGQAFRGVGPWV